MNTPTIIDISNESQVEETDVVGIFSDYPSATDISASTTTTTVDISAETAITPRRAPTKRNKRQRFGDENSPFVSMVVSLATDATPSFVESPRRSIETDKQLQGYRWLCDPTRVENLWNKDTATSFNSQLKHELYEGKREHINRERDMHLSTTFLVGTGMEVLLGLLKAKAGDIDERVVIAITSGKNEVKFYASHFLNEVVPHVNRNLLCSGKDTIYLQASDCVKIEIYKDSITTWIVLRRYVDGYVMEKLYISIAS
jgi:hypothetical protein